MTQSYHRFASRIGPFRDERPRARRLRGVPFSRRSRHDHLQKQGANDMNERASAADELLR